MLMAAPPIEAKVKQKTTIKKKCPICEQRKPLSDFYVNSLWTEEHCTDKWCKSCVQKLSSKADFRRYLWDNRREWSDEVWRAMSAAAEKRLQTNAVYLKQTDERRKAMVERMAIQQFPSFVSRFKFIEVPEGKEHPPYDEAVLAGNAEVEEDDPSIKEYSDFFNGNFTKQELAYLTKYYDKLEEDFVLDNENLRDYAKKCARASLQADKAQDDYAAGRCSFADVKDALTQFDMLSKSANFAACKRKAGETSGLTCWAETTLYLETHGYCKENKVEWPEDDVDRVIASLNHTVKALGLDQI